MDSQQERKILIADDDPDIVELIDETLSVNNFTVLKADNGYSVLSKAKSEHPDLIILDLMLPRLDGYQTCKRLKEFSGTQNIPILIISGYIKKEMILKLLAMGIKNYLAKPFDIDELINRVNLLYNDYKTKIKRVSNLKTNIKISENIMTVILSGEFEESDTSFFIDTLKKRITPNITKIIINIANLKVFGVEHIKYFADVNNYFKEKNIVVKISTGDTKNLRASLIRNSALSDLLLAY